MATVTLKEEKDGVLSETKSFGPGPDELQRLNSSLEAFSEQKTRRRKRPFAMLAVVFFLFLASGAGVALAVFLFMRPVREAEGMSLARLLVLIASGMSLLYTAIHVRGAFSNYVNDAPHIPPHFRGEYVHAFALIVARLTIGVWIAASVATAIFVYKSPHPFGVSKNQIPFPLLDSVICVVALTSFLIIAATINKHPTPFALAGISRSSLLTKPTNVFIEVDNEPFLSISRRASLQRAAGEKLAPAPPSQLAKPTQRSAKRMTLTKEALAQADYSRRAEKPSNLDVTRVADDDAKTELMANSPVRANYYTTPPVPSLPPKLRKAATQRQRSVSPGSGGGWQDEWNSLADETGMRPPTTEASSADSQQAYSMSNYSSASSMTSAAPVLSTRQLQLQRQQQKRHQQRPSTSHSHVGSTPWLPPTRPASSYQQPVMRPGSSYQQPVMRPSSSYQRPPMRPATSYQLPPARPGSSYQRPSPRPGTAGGGYQVPRKLRHSPSSSFGSNDGSSGSGSGSGSATPLRTPRPIAARKATAAQQEARPGDIGPAPVEAPQPPRNPPSPPNPPKMLRRKASNFSRPITPINSADSQGTNNSRRPKTAG